MKKTKKISVEKLSISDCKKILCGKGKVYSDNEIISIRDLLYCFAEVDVETFYNLEQRENEFAQNDLESSNVLPSIEDCDLDNVA